MRFVRPPAVEQLADAYRNRHTELGQLILANRHHDFTPAECALALSQIRTEAEAAMIVLLAERDLFDPAVDDQIRAILELSDEVIEALHRLGFLDDDDLDTPE